MLLNATSCVLSKARQIPGVARSGGCTRSARVSLQREVISRVPNEVLNFEQDIWSNGSRLAFGDFMRKPWNCGPIPLQLNYRLVVK